MGDRVWGVGPPGTDGWGSVGWACRSLGMADLPGGVAHRERRRGPMSPMLRAGGLAGGDLSELARQVVRAPDDVEIASPGLSPSGRALLHVGKQERGVDGATGVSRNIGMSFWRDMAASQVRRNGEGFSNSPYRASGCCLPLFSD